MVKRVVVLVSLVFFILGLSGCATARKQKELEIQGLKNQISVLESQIQSRDEEINSLKEALSKQQEKEAQGIQAKLSAKNRAISEVKSRPKIKQIQIALTNAGFYSGRIDGKKGPQTKEALRAFQKAHNLPETGKCDKETWAQLKNYLYKKVK